MNQWTKIWVWGVVCLCLPLVLMASSLTSCVGAAEQADESGHWLYVLENGEATITGQKMQTSVFDSWDVWFSVPESDDTTILWQEGEEPAIDLAIPEGLDGYVVTGIGDKAFQWRSDLTGIIIPDSVTRIGDRAFAYCRGLTGIIIPDNIRSIGDRAFAGCPLTFIHVSSDNPVYEHVDGVLFDKRQKMLIAYPGAKEGAYAIPEGVLYINDFAFDLSERLTSLTLPDSVTGIGDSAFIRCSSLTSVTLSSSMTSIGDYAFASCSSLTGVTIPKSVTSIGQGAFSYCGSLNSVTIPDSVTNIGGGAFASCKSLTDITIPAGVTSIGGNPFSGCPLTFIHVSPGNPVYEQIDGVLFDKRQKMLMAYPNAREGAYAIPEGVLHINASALRHSDRLISLTIPDGITILEGEMFLGCHSLISLTVPASVTHIDDWEFSYDLNEHFTMSVVTGSYAEQYAKDSGIAYASVE